MFDTSNNKLFKMKKILITLILIPYISFSQVLSSVDFHVVNDGMESDYLKLEQIWREFHEKNIEDGTMIRWTLLKVNENKGSLANGATYVTVNTFPSEEDSKSIWEGMTGEKFTKLVRKRLKGKMTFSEINKTLKSKSQKGVHTYYIQPLGGTSTSAPLEIGDTIFLDAMSQQNDEYENYENSFAKEVMQYNVDNGNLKLWGFTKVNGSNDSALKEVTHFTWRVPVKDGSFEWNSDNLIKKFGNKFVYDKMWNLTAESRTVPGNVKLEIIDILQK